jgi:saccharopine dehydrogenase-like NADP-dependent oxidoreductase
LSDEELPLKKGSHLDILAARLLEKLVYKPGERDMIILRHDFIASYTDRKERILSTFIGYGDSGGATAMAKTVGLPAAIASRMVLEAKIQEKGVHIPVIPDIYEPILQELEAVGIAFDEKSSIM